MEDIAGTHDGIEVPDGGDAGLYSQFPTGTENGGQALGDFIKGDSSRIGAGKLDRLDGGGIDDRAARGIGDQAGSSLGQGSGEAGLEVILQQRGE